MPLSFVVALVALVVGTVLGGRPTPVAAAETLVFRTTLAKFVATADSPDRDERLDWTSDGCSAPLVESTGRTFDFTNPCRRHDFAYRNIARLDGGRRWTAAMRARVDSVFRRDMRAGCAVRPRIERLSCNSWAEIFYRVVRTRGGP